MVAKGRATEMREQIRQLKKEQGRYVKDSPYWLLAETKIDMLRADMSPLKKGVQPDLWKSYHRIRANRCVCGAGKKTHQQGKSAVRRGDTIRRRGDESQIAG